MSIYKEFMEELHTDGINGGSEAVRADHVRRRLEVT
jgi:hypothetical protein